MGAISALESLSRRRSRSNILRELRDLHAAYGEVVVEDSPLFPVVHLFGPDANRFVLTNSQGRFSTRKPWNSVTGKLFPKGLLEREGAEHRTHRHVMQPALRRPTLRKCAPVMGQMIRVGLSRWPANSRAFLVSPALRDLTLNIVGTLLLGGDPHCRGFQEDLRPILALSPIGRDHSFPGYDLVRSLTARRSLKRNLQTLMETKGAHFSDDLFSRLCHATEQTSNLLGRRDAIEHMMFVLMAAVDTTASALTSIMYTLAKNPDWQTRTRLDSEGLDGGDVGFDDFDRLENLTWVIKETLRQYPPLAVIRRFALADVRFAGRKIPGRALVIIAPLHTHHMEAWWNHPDVFDPERFSPGRAEQELHTHSWIPFGGGIHHCLGFRFAELQLKSVLHHLLREYRWTVPPDYVMSVDHGPVAEPSDDLPLQLERVRASDATVSSYLVPDCADGFSDASRLDPV